MFDNYPDKIKILREKEQKDKFGYATETETIEQSARFVGMETLQINENNSYREEMHYKFHIPVEILPTDKIVYKEKTMNVKSVYEVRDIFNKVIFWKVELA